METARHGGSRGWVLGMALGGAVGLVLGLAAVAVRPVPPTAAELMLADRARELLAELESSAPVERETPVVSRRTYAVVLDVLSTDHVGPLPDPATDPALRESYRRIVEPHRFRPSDAAAELLEVEHWLQDAARLAEVVETTDVADPGVHVHWSLVAMALAADLGSIGSVDYLRAAGPLGITACEQLRRHARDVCHRPGTLADTYRLLQHARHLVPDVARIVASERRMARAMFLGLAGVEPFSHLRHGFELAEPPAAPVMVAGLRELDDYPGRLRALLSNLGDEHERWSYLQWASRLTRSCPEAGLVVASPESVIGFDRALPRLLEAELCLRVTEEFLATGRYPDSVAGIFAAVVQADPRLPDDLAEPAYHHFHGTPGFELCLTPATDHSLRQLAREGDGPALVSFPQELPFSGTNNEGVAAARSDR